MTETFDFLSRAVPRRRNAVRNFRSAHGFIARWEAEHAHPWVVLEPQPDLWRLHHPVELLNMVDDVEMAFADGVHNLRIIFDALAQEFAHLVERPKEGDTYFPVTQREAQWDAAVSKLATMPPLVLERMKALQSWSNPPLRMPDLLNVITGIDNQDKHRFGLQLVAQPLDRLEIPPQVIPVPGDLAHDYRFWSSRPPIHQVAGPPRMIQVPQLFMIVGFTDRAGELLTLQHALLADVERAVNYLRSGRWTHPQGEVTGLANDDDALIPLDLRNVRREQARLGAGAPLKSLFFNYDPRVLASLAERAQRARGLVNVPHLPQGTRIATPKTTD